MTTSEYAALSLKEKEEYWLKALKHKSEDDELTEEQWWYEWEERTLYEDENICLTKNYVNEFVVVNKKKEVGRTVCFEALLRYVDFGKDLCMEGYEGKNIVDYMREREFPLTFLTWI